MAKLFHERLMILVRHAGGKHLKDSRSDNEFNQRILYSIFIISAIVASCSPRIPEHRPSPQQIKTNVPSGPNVQQFLPDGWADITSRSKQQQIKLWLVNRDYSATMVMRELQADSVTQRSLLQEEMNLIAMISLHGKIPENDPDFRVTRVPAQIDVKRNISSYTYTQKGLLRRVVVFRKQNKLFELELMQEQPLAEFEALSNDLLLLATKLYER